MKHWRPWRDPRPHAWGNKYTLALFVVVVIGLFLGYRQFFPEPAERLGIGMPVPSEARLSEAQRPVAESVSRRVSTNLADFRAQYRPVQIDIRVRATDAASTTSTVVETLERWLTAQQLRSGRRSEFTPAESVGAVQLIHAPRQERYAQHFAQALSPYLNATVERRSDSRLGPGQLFLIINQAPRFDEDGRVFFQE